MFWAAALWLCARRPLSLFEGRAGALALLGDLLADDGGAAGARFPLFEMYER